MPKLNWTSVAIGAVGLIVIVAVILKAPVEKVPFVGSKVKDGVRAGLALIS